MKKSFFSKSNSSILRIYLSLTIFSFLDRITQQWYLWNSLTKGKVLRPINNKSKQENKFYRRNFLYSHDSLLPMQVSVCPSVCLSVCPSANYSFISWQICTVMISMDSSCKGKGFKTIWQQIYAKIKKIWQKDFFSNCFLSSKHLINFEDLLVC